VRKWLMCGVRAEETLKKAERAAQEQAAAAIDLVNAAEDKAKRKIEEANKLAQQSQAEAEAKKLALKKEIEDAMADGVIDESEQRAIDIKQAALDAAEAAQNEAKAAAAATAAEAATMLAKAEAEAQVSLPCRCARRRTSGLAPFLRACCCA